MGGVRLNEGMPISLEDLQQHINQSGFKPDARMRAQALEIIWNGIQLFRENKERTYRSHTGMDLDKKMDTEFL